MEVTLEIVVRSTEIDVNGHVNNAKYVEYLEWGREEWYERQGFDSGRLRALDAITVVVNLHLNYQHPCHQVRERWPRARWPLSGLIATFGPKTGA